MFLSPSLPKPFVRLCQSLGIQPSDLLDRLQFWAGWTGLTWLAFLVSLLFVEIGERQDISFIDGLLGGALIGLAQWQMLRSRLPSAHRWIWASALSWGALALFHLGAVGWMAPGSQNMLVRSVFGIFYGGYVGLILGFAQWWVLRPQVPQAWLWVPLSAGVWSVAIAFGWLLGGSLRATSHLFVSEVVGLLFAWGAISALSGIGIVGLFHPDLLSLSPFSQGLPIFQRPTSGQRKP